jgi:hypothetical protein
LRGEAAGLSNVIHDVMLMDHIVCLLFFLLRFLFLLTDDILLLPLNEPDRSPTEMCEMKSGEL